LKKFSKIHIHDKLKNYFRDLNYIDCKWIPSEEDKSLKPCQEIRNDLLIRQKLHSNETYALESDEVFLLGATKMLKTTNFILKRKEGERYSPVEYLFEHQRMFSNIYSSQGFPLSWLSSKFNYLIETYDKFLLEAEQQGFTQYFYDSYFIDFRGLHSTEDPKVLTMKMLSAGFIAWLVSVAIACIVFIIEQIVAFVTRKQKKVNPKEEIHI
jgi:hypothetical protein